MLRYQRVIHTLLNYLYSHIVYSNKSCMFEVLQRCSQPNTTIMKIYQVIKNRGLENEKIVLTTNCEYEAHEEMMNLDSHGYPSTYRLKK